METKIFPVRPYHFATWRPKCSSTLRPSGFGSRRRSGVSRESDEIVCEVRDQCHYADDRRRPPDSMAPFIAEDVGHRHRPRRDPKPCEDGEPHPSVFDYAHQP